MPRLAPKPLHLSERERSELESVRAIVSVRLPLAVKEMELKGLDLEDPNSWWELLFIDGVIRIENAQGKPIRVAIYLMDNWRTAVKTLLGYRVQKVSDDTH